MVFSLMMLFFTTLFAHSGFEAPWGKDSELNREHFTYIDPAPSADLLAKGIESVILFHQNVISPIDGPRSHFRPTSSRYMLLAIRRYGFLQGYLMGCDRLLRENSDPWVYPKVKIGSKTYLFDPTY
ncbi:MAG: hypothetical protein A3F09_00880 [Chlamydiae bacterium RIFCSPHIGHO2_12_FULL_49_11]|nr:MAG: hypothetical protein A3F09_00880 [Chlamydiae bacterium RIFCSPHIGHO2_12_FULL_49_11]